jgi:hypothetical protein
MAKNESVNKTGDDEEFRRSVGVPLETVMRVYQRAVENDWRTVQTTTQKVIHSFAASRTSAKEAEELMRLTRAILASENGKHLEIAGLPR